MRGRLVSRVILGGPARRDLLTELAGGLTSMISRSVSPLALSSLVGSRRGVEGETLRLTRNERREENLS